MGVTQNPQGWTDVTHSADSRISYVDPAYQGGDAKYYVDGDVDWDNDIGPDPYSPVGNVKAFTSLAAAKANMRDGFPDWILIKKGATVIGSFGTIGLGDLAGRSSQEPSLISAYGAGQRPIMTVTSGHWAEIYREFIFFIGLKILSQRTGPNPDNGAGIRFWGGGVFNAVARECLVEDCFLDGWKENLTVQGTSFVPVDITIRRNSVYRSWTSKSEQTEGRSQGLFASGTTNLTIEENTFYHNGWDNNEPSSYHEFQSHNMYLSAAIPGLVCNDNYLLDGASQGIKLQPADGSIVITGNIYSHNTIHQQLGGGKMDPSWAGIDVAFSRNVLLRTDIHKLPDGTVVQNIGWSCVSTNIASGVCEDNLFFRGPYETPNDIGLQLTVSATGFEGAGINNMSWTRTIIYDLGAGSGGSLSVVDNGLINGIRNSKFSDGDISSKATASKRLIDAPNGTTGFICGNNTYTSSGSDALKQLFRISGTQKSFLEWSQDAPDVGSELRDVAYTDPTRTLERYMDFVEGTSGSTLEQFASKLLQQSREAWDQNYSMAAVRTWITDGWDINNRPPASPNNLTVMVA